MTEFEAFHAVTHPIVRLADDWNNLLDHGLEKTPDYIVRHNGTIYEVIDGSTGKIFSSNADATTAINTAIGTGNSDIFLKGVFEIMGTIHMKDSTTLRGHRGNGVDDEGTVLKAMFNGDIVDIVGNAGDYVTDVTIQDLSIISPLQIYSGAGIRTTYTNRFTLLRLFIYGFKGYALNFQTDTWEGYIANCMTTGCGNAVGPVPEIGLYNSNNIRWFRNTINEYYGIGYYEDGMCFNNNHYGTDFESIPPPTVTPAYPNMQVYGVYSTFEDCMFIRCGVGTTGVTLGGYYGVISHSRFTDMMWDALIIYGVGNIINGNTFFVIDHTAIMNSGNYTTITNNKFEDVTTHAIQDGPMVPVNTGTIITGNSCMIDALHTGVGDHGIALYSDYTVVKYNDLRESVTPFENFGGLTHNEVSENLGFKTENFGVASGGAATTVNINHGFHLSAAPDTVIVTKAAAGMGDIRVSLIDATKFTAVWDNNVPYTFYWYARNNPSI